MANLNNNSLRRYTGSEYAMKAISVLWREDKDNVFKELNEMENLEALACRGFWFDHRRNCYSNGRIDVSPCILDRKKAYELVDKKIELLRSK